MLKERKQDKVLRVCDVCGHEQWVNYWNVYRKDIHVCRYCSCRETARTRTNAPWNLGKKQKPRNLGNTYINTNGYVEVWVGKHTDENKVGGYYREHKLLYELFLERKLSSKELIHHVDGDKTNNRLSNLALCSDHHEHQKIHGSLERVGMSLVKAGLISFDAKTKQYFIDPNMSNHISKSLELLGTPEKDNQQRSFSEMSEEERSTTIQKWSTLKRVEAGDNPMG